MAVVRKRGCLLLTTAPPAFMQTRFFFTCIMILSYTAEETYVVVDWVGEETSSVIQSIRVGGGIFRVGDVSNIRISGGQYQGIVISSGK